ncbi:hypothetical protein SCB71_06460 [Herbiconiux sp. KACC 21604]|uniref:hypothetical protein n=1 Tax=unclassified Herbiconiux TaxID=2618217 RepID=UPI0014931B57|nr:hypothetical protein [Herbiconiux sp. SALV-R1]QJU52957.1 hypothetical protein HL652_04445 [Herbiconiux sp. SALV-R1]WPO87881.1 hypothetical protein SCB71_06460 [Herbiconiux sp. KACC 21604]
MKTMFNVVELVTDKDGFEFSHVESEHDSLQEATVEAQRLNRDYAHQSLLGAGDSVEFIVDEVQVDDDDVA